MIYAQIEIWKYNGDKLTLFINIQMCCLSHHEDQFSCYCHLIMKINFDKVYVIIFYTSGICV